MDLGTAGAPDLLIGNNGSGKTTFAQLVRFVLAPAVFEASGRRGWRSLFPDQGVGHVALEWHDPISRQSVVLGLAAVRHPDRLEWCRYSLPLMQGAGIRSVPLAEHSSALEQTHRCLVEAAGPHGEAPFFTTNGEEWRRHLESFGLGADSIYLVGDVDLRGRWMADRAAFVAEAVRQLAPAILLEDLTGEDGTELSSDEALARLLPAAKTLLRALGAVEEFSTVSIGPGSVSRPLVRVRFIEPSDEVLREHLLELLDRHAPAQWYAAVTAMIQGAVDVSVLVDLGREPQHMSLERWESRVSWSSQEVTTVLLATVFARVRASLGGVGSAPALVFMDLPRVTGTGRSEIEVLYSWGLHVVYLTANYSLDDGEFPPADAGRIYHIVDVNLSEVGARFTRIVSTVALASMAAERADRHNFEPLTDVFEVLDPGVVEWRDGDLIVPYFRWCGTSDNVRIASAARPPSAARFTILRPKHTLRPEGALLYCRYFGGDAILGADPASRRQLITISVDDLALLMVPRLDRSTLRALADLTEAAADFGHWRREAMTAIDAFFRWRDVSVARADIIAAGRLTRQRREAVQVLDAFTSRVRTTMPHPIASRWRFLDATRPDEAGYRAILDCAETVVTYCAAVGVQFAIAHQVTLPKLRALSSQIGRGIPISFGVWTTILTDLADVASSASMPADSPLRNFARFGGDVALAVAALKRIRNNLAHGRVPGIHEIPPQYASARAELEKLVAAAEWLADYPLRHVDEAIWDSFTNSTKVGFRELMGDHSVVDQRHDGTAGNVELFSPYAVDQLGRYYLLRPLVHTAVCQGCGQLTVFVLDRWIPSQSHAEFKALNHGDGCQVSCEAALRAVGLLTT